MKKLHFPIVVSLLLLALTAQAQAPQRMSFQAVVRDAAGKLVVERTVAMRLSILRGSPNGTVVFSEIHQPQTNANGLASLEIGTGTATTGILAAIDWALGPYFLKTEADPEGGTSFGISGISQLLSVPYALHAKTAENGDQVVTLAGSGNVTISGDYPNFNIHGTGGGTGYNPGTGIAITGTTITNTAPDQNVTLTGSGATTVSGTYPNFNISSNDSNTTYNAGAGIAITGTTITNTAPDQTVNFSGGTGITVSGAYPNFTVALAPSSTHFVGEMFGGGIVFYTYDNGQHGLIASLTDLGTTSSWHTSTSSNTSATSYYDGSSNTSNIVAVQGNGVYAAKLCDNYSVGGFSDWYLPSLWELNLLYQNGFMVSFKLANDGNPGTSPMTATGSYWSSTQFDPNLSYMVYFPDGTPYLDFKDKLYRVRAVRRF